MYVRETPELTFLDCDSSESPIKISSIFIGERGLLYVDLGTVDLIFGVSRHVVF